ncbi:MAG: MltA domain-containing protein, partial [Planctomycetes bacterium]|nr:MltA domain-containing protein [Planctomycetota bacterium]
MNRIALLCLFALLGSCRSQGPQGPDYGRELPFGVNPLIRLEPGEIVPNVSATWTDRASFLPALKKSIHWTNLKYSHQFFPAAEISHATALQSLERFQELLLNCKTPNEFQAAVETEFDFYRSAGWDGRGGGVLFTGYCTPVLDGSLTPTASYKYPLYSLPPDLVKADDGTILGRQTSSGVQPYPTRRTLETTGMLANQGLELV